MNKPLVGLMTQGPKGRENILLMVGPNTYTVNRATCPKFDEVIKAFTDGDYDLIPGLVSASAALSNFLSSTGATEVTFDEDHIIVNGKQLAPVMSKLLLDMYQAGTPMAPYVEFLERLDDTANMTIRDYLFEWMQRANLPISTDGKLYAFRANQIYDGEDFISENGYPVTTGDLVDGHSGLYRNNVGDIVSMKRSAVNDDRHNACASGLHFASESYAMGFGGIGSAITIIEVDPADVVMIPASETDKGRCCRYEVIGVVRHPDSDIPLNKAALGDAPVVAKEDVKERTSNRWIVFKPSGEVEGRYRSRAKAIKARNTLNNHHPGHYWRDGDK